MARWIASVSLRIAIALLIAASILVPASAQKNKILLSNNGITFRLVASLHDDV